MFTVPDGMDRIHRIRYVWPSCRQDLAPKPEQQGFVHAVESPPAAGIVDLRLLP